jgi:hypothetical protein
LTRQSERTSFQQLKKPTAQALALPLWAGMAMILNVNSRYNTEMAQMVFLPTS